MTRITTDHTACDRCDTDLTEAVERHMDDGGPEECPRCGLGFVVSAVWMQGNGYEVQLPDAIEPGRVPRLTEDYITACRSNEDDETLEDWIATWSNCPVVEIDDEGSVFVGRESGLGGHDGRWLDEPELADMVAAIERGC